MLCDLPIIGEGAFEVEVDVWECKEAEEEEEEDEEEEVVEDEDRVIAAVPVAGACDDGDRFFHDIKSFISEANKQKGTPASTLLLLSVSSMHAGAGGRAGRCGCIGGLKVSTNDKEDEGATPVVVAVAVPRGRMAVAAAVASAALSFFFFRDVSTIFNLSMSGQG